MDSPWLESKFVFKKQFYIINKITKRIVKLFFNINCSSTYKFISTVFTLWDNHGFKFMISYMKTVRLHITRYLCHQPLKVNDKRVSLINGFPSKFIYLKKYIDSGDFNSISYVLTLLNITRGLSPTKKERLSIKPSFDSIVSPSKVGEYQYHIPEWFIEQFCGKFHLYESIPKLSNKDHYISMKGSPEGKASWCSIWSIFGHTYSTMNYLLTLYGSQGFSEIFTKQWESLYDKFGENEYILGKLSIVHDPECKERVIAMVDYHSQLALKSIHDQLLKKLNNFPCDRTFTQDPFHSWDTGIDKFWSLDLSSATDRFPIYLQEKLLRNIYGSDEFARSWKLILTDRDYHYPKENLTLRYSVGQPMGAYSSWVVFALTHHLVVHYAAHCCGISDFNQYILLGDDIVIKNNKVADKYKGIMMRMGVEVSYSKTHASYDTYEFAKRWIKAGKEISGVPLRGIIQNVKSLRIVFSDLYEYNQRVPNYKLENSLFLVAKVMENINVSYKRRNSFKDIIRYLNDFRISYRFSQNNLTDSEFRNWLCFKFRHDQISIPRDELIPLFIKGVLSTGLAETALDTMSDLKGYCDKITKHFEDPTLVPKSPIVHGLIHSCENMIQYVEAYASDSMTFNDVIRRLTPVNVESIARKDRDKIIIFDYLDSVFKRSFHYYYFNDDEMKDYLSSFVNTKFDIELEDQWSFSLTERLRDEKTKLNELLV